jgi:hypothetical protein
MAHQLEHKSPRKHQLLRASEEYGFLDALGWKMVSALAHVSHPGRNAPSDRE